MKKLLFTIGMLMSLVIHAAPEKFVIPTISSHKTEADNRIDFSLQYPYFQHANLSSQEKQFNLTVDDIIDTETGNFRSLTYSVDRQSLPPSLAKVNSSFTLTYQVLLTTRGDEPIVSILFDVDTFLVGSAHPNLTHRVINFNFKSGEAIAIAELFKSGYDFTKPLNRYIAARLSPKTHSTEKQMVANNEINYSQWNITQKGLLITMDEFPHVYGLMQVLIPYQEMRSYLNLKGPLALCLDNANPLECR